VSGSRTFVWCSEPSLLLQPSGSGFPREPERHVIDCANPDFRQIGCVHPRVLRFAPVRERVVSDLPRIAVLRRLSAT
jgi:hypothetical protein